MLNPFGNGWERVGNGGNGFTLFLSVEPKFGIFVRERVEVL